MEDFLKKTKQKHLQFYVVFHITLVKETRDGIIEQVKNPSSQFYKKINTYGYIWRLVKN